MLNAFLHLAVTPGPYKPPTVVAAPKDAGVPWMLFVALGFMLAAVFLVIAEVEEAAIPLVIGAVVIGGIGLVTMTVPDEDRDKDTHAHEQSVKAKDRYDLDYEAKIRTWLHDDYDITTDAGSVHTLRAGGQMVASTANGQKMIQLVETTTHDLAVQVVGGDIIQPGSLDR
jgi:hypothetical protein